MIQILGLRTWLAFDGKPRTKVAYFDKGMRLEQIEDVFNETKVLEQINKLPKDEHFNLYFTVASCHDQERVLKEQWVIPFDIDGIEDASPAAVARAACAALGVNPDHTASIASGNGVWLFIKLPLPIVNDEYFDKTRLHYKEWCIKINRALAANNIKGAADSTAWSAARLARLPFTNNIKQGKITKRAVVIQGTLTTSTFDLCKSGLEVHEDAQSIPDKILKQYPKPDTKEVLTGCEFLKYNFANQAKVLEPQWYADLSIRARLEDGRNLCHTASNQHPSYNYDDCDLKIDQALKSAGPRTCQDISTRWDGCIACPHWGKITSPILIRGEDYIRSQDSGFRLVTIKNGAPIRGKPVYSDLIKQFGKEHPFVVIEGSRTVYIFNGKYWDKFGDERLKQWVYHVLDPVPENSNELSEFTQLLKATNIRSMDWFYHQSEGKMNFQNGVLDLNTMKVEPHNMNYGFLQVLPFDYNPHADCPTWDKLMMDWMEGDSEMVYMLNAFAGYAISGDKIWTEKILLITGSGGNGKSRYIETIRDIAGKSNVSVIPVETLSKPESRMPLTRALFNYSEEVSARGLYDSEALKALSSGGTVQCRALYENPIEFTNKCKFILSANETPYCGDKSNAIKQRLLIAPFNVTFRDTDKAIPKHILNDMVTKELPGVCNRFIATYRETKQRGYFILPKKGQDAVEEFVMNSSNCLSFFNDECTLVPDNEEYKDEVFQSYMSWCRDTNTKATTAHQFWKILWNKYPVLEESRSSRESGRKRTIKGMKLLTREIE